MLALASCLLQAGMAVTCSPQNTIRKQAKKPDTHVYAVYTAYMYMQLCMAGLSCLHDAISRPDSAQQHATLLGLKDGQHPATTACQPASQL